MRFRFDRNLRSAIAAHLSGFDRLTGPPEPPSTETSPALRAAAVVFPVVPLDRFGQAGEAGFLLTRRTPRLSAHGGQWALPGGRIDAGESPEEAALRELAEELGLVCPQTDILGPLDDYCTRSGYCITPLVAWVEDLARLAPNPAEVASVHAFPLAELMREGTPEFVRIPESERPVIRMPLGPDPDEARTIHAPTAAILYQFREVALAGRPTRVHGLEQPVFAWR
ncbi:MAG: CoA pyrophosphatase [Alphaproteobacteria bacterium]|nr:CoA pyrophosphatase [Alphaproteobacteria bacterium]